MKAGQTMHPGTVRAFSYAIYFCLFIFGLQLIMIGPLLEKMSVAFGRPASSVGTLISLTAAGFMVAVVGACILADRIGKKKVVAIASLGFAFSLLLFAVSDHFALSAAIFFLIGGFGGILESLLSALIADLQPGRAQSSVTLAHVFFGLGAIAGPALTGWMADGAFSWRYAYAAAGALALISAGWLLLYPYPAIKPEERIRAGHVKWILRNGSFQMLCLALAIYVGVEMSVTAWTAKFFTSEFDYTGFSAGLIVGLFWIMIAAGRLVFSWLSARFPAGVLIRCLAVMAGAGLVWLWLSASPAAAVVGIVMTGFGLSAIWPLIVAEAGTLFGPQYTGTSFGLIIASGGLGQMFIPALVGYFADVAPMRQAWGLLGVLMAAIALIHYFAGRRTSPEVG